MTRISLLYPRAAGRRFDMDYYLDTHMPLSIRLLGKHPGFKGVSVDRGVGGAVPGAPAPYVAMCHFLFGTAEQFMEVFLPNAAVLQGDIANYTDIEPVIQLSEVMIARP